MTRIVWRHQARAEGCGSAALGAAPLAFYKSRFGGNAASFDTASGSVLTLNKSPQESVVVTISAESSEDNGKTRIHIVHTTASKPS